LSTLLFELDEPFLLFSLTFRILSSKLLFELGKLLLLCCFLLLIFRWRLWLVRCSGILISAAANRNPIDPMGAVGATTATVMAGSCFKS
jgi:hypothetical protein